VCEIPVLRDSTALGVTGSTAFWPDKGQTYCFTSDDPIGQIHVICRSDGQWSAASDAWGAVRVSSKTSTTSPSTARATSTLPKCRGQRVQRFLYKGGLPGSAKNSAWRMKTGRSSTGAPPGLRDPNEQGPPAGIRP